jgi:NAD(P)-dependent dehydrogenase (short-subunit alcohol dehydrogenase family)
MTQHILIIGASRGLGLELTRQYTQAGARVTATARDDAGLAAIQALGAKPLKLDIANPQSVSGLAWQLDGEKFDLALYVAGVYNHDNALTPPTQQEFDRVMHTNVMGLMQTIPQVLPLVEAAGGKFLALSSMMGSLSAANESYGWLYRVSKAALNMAVNAARHDYPKALMFALNPGWVRTDLGGPNAPLSPQDSASQMRHVIDTLTSRDVGRLIHHDGLIDSGW